jgi:type IV secretory pathway VirB10-like protein
MTILFPEKKKTTASSSINIDKSATKATTHLFSNDIESIESQKIVSGGVSQSSPNSQQNGLTSLIASPSSTPYPMKIYAAPSSEEATMSESYLPFGRLIKCVLVNTVDSSRIATPIIGMVTEDVWQAGVCVIPAGTEIHGTAQIDRSRERIASEKDWIVVWQDGKELPVKGIALSNTQRGTQEKWGITDGAAGLEGEILKSDKLAQLKEILASTVAAAGAGLVPVTTTTSPFGNTQVATTGSAQAVLGSSVQAAGKVYAEQIMQSIQRDGWFVRCKAGSTFYLYTLEAVDFSNAGIGSSKHSKPEHS